VESFSLESERTLTTGPVPPVRPSGITGLSRSTRSTTPLPAEASSLDDAEDLLLVQMRYDAYLAARELQILFESGGLECLGD
jgi:hypothetical protein